jgi:hypothetical protein
LQFRQLAFVREIATQGKNKMARIPMTACARLATSFVAHGLGALLTAASVAHAQELALPRSVIVRVTVVGNDGAGLAGVNLAISRQSVGAILSGRTNDSGVSVFRIAIEPGDYAVLARRPGFAPVDTALTFDRSDTVVVVLRLQQAPPTQLAPVTIEASRSNYVLDASQIAASRRPIRDALEALRKLRPSMLHDRDRCRTDPVDNVWVNGRRVLFMASQTPIFEARSSVGAGSKVATVRKRQGEPPAVDSVLASIRAEHISQIRLVNCWDTSLPGVGANNALYVSLKPGVDWDWKRGSFVADSGSGR